MIMVNPTYEESVPLGSVRIEALKHLYSRHWVPLLVDERHAFVRELVQLANPVPRCVRSSFSADWLRFLVVHPTSVQLMS